MSSSDNFLAWEITNSLICSTESPDFATLIIIYNPNHKFNAVGLVSKRIFLAFSKSDNNSSFVVDLLCNTANANQKAPDTPIAGAPLTTKVIMSYSNLLKS